MLIRARHIVAALAAGILIFQVAGCKTTGTERAARASESLAALQAEIQKTSDQLGVSVTALDDLVKNPNPDLKPQFDTFSKAMEVLEAQIAATRSRSEAMKARGKEYFTAWEEDSKALSSQEMREYSMERRSQLNATYDTIKAEVQSVGELGKPLMDALRDTRRVLSMDLTPAGLDLAKGPAEKATASAAELRTEIEKLQKDLDGVAKLLAPPKAATPTAESPKAEPPK